MKKNRLKIILIVFLIAFFVLLARLFNLTIINGATYREFSDKNRIKQINKDASRGIIYDRNGKPIAENKLVYNLKVYSDRFNKLDNKERNELLTNLVELLEDDGVNYLNDYFFSYYEFAYKNKDDYFNGKVLPKQKIIELIKDEDILKEIFTRSHGLSESEFYPFKRMRDYLILRGKEIPVELSTKDGLQIEFIKNEEYKHLIDNEIIISSTEPLDYIVSEIKDDSSFLSYLIDHPLSRKIVYDVLNEKNLIDDIELTDIIFSSDLNYLENKSILNSKSKNVSRNSQAKDDFLNLVKDVSLESLLTTAYKSEDKYIIPASILISDLEKKGITTNLTYEVNEKNNFVELKFNKNNSSASVTALDKLIELARENNILDEYILSKDVIDFAERSLFDMGIYPRIYKSKWEYSYIADKEDLLKKYKEKDISAKDLFIKLLDKYELDNSDPYVNYGVLSIIELTNKYAYMGYKPINVASNLSKDALVKIEEYIPKDSGFEIDFQPSRYYPNANTASHIVGYLGGISEEQELQHYVEYKKYDINDNVGKTGLEESFEDTLRGTKGSQLVYTDVYGRTTDVIQSSDAKPGNNLFTTIDIDFQKEVEDILHDAMKAMRDGTPYQTYFGPVNFTRAKNAEVGVAVVMDVKTGEVLSLVSLPDYNPNLFVNGISSTDWNKLNNFDPKDIFAPRPIMNNAIQSAFAPGSTFKTVTSLAALENGLDPTDPIDSYGYVQVGNSRFHELLYTNTGRRWGNINLYDALRVSSNYYFYVLGLGYNPNKANDLDVKVSLEDIESITARLGMKEPTGIEINKPQESRGHTPSLDGKINILKGRLASYLRGNLDQYIKEGVEISETKMQSDIVEIVSWLEEGPSLTIDEIAKRLSDLGYDSESVLEGKRESLSSYIKFTYQNQAVWTVSDSMNMVIGQGQNGYTALQMTQLASTIANKGELVKPTLIKEIKDYSNKETIYKNEKKTSETGIKSKYFEDVTKGMVGTHRNRPYGSRFPFEIAAKTGTAQPGLIDPKTGEFYDDLGSEMTFAPADNPEIAVYVQVVQAKQSLNMQAIINDIYYSYYKLVKKDSRFTNVRPGSSFTETTVETEENNQENESNAQTNNMNTQENE
ncbi:penicillin-binding transpeptidase domain-containing protein [uncultured Helcococcus sp.]|uniref:penicillin-binding transpeptidase domain-containing protein n=1 Tax=uncultured Helcococcus sp. TaxID=1072508 RepID=UPI00260EB789|nr:penicillin-binding transpeptidase domain-containing protein [uncultured Helcococcus sp.]